MTLRAQGRRRTRTTVGAVVCAVVALAGCTPSVDEPAGQPAALRDVATFEDLGVPAELQPAHPQVSTMNLLGGTAKLPLVVAGTRAEAGTPPRLAVWRTKAGGRIKDRPTYLDTVGVPVAVDLAGGTKRAAVAGYSWTGTGYTPFVFTSADRKAWDPVEIPDDLSGMRLTQVAVDGSSVRVFGTDREHKLVAAEIADGTLAPIDAPGVDHVAGVTAASSADGSLVVTLDRDPGDDDRDVVLTSRDGGTAWERSALKSGSNVVDAIAHPGGALVLLGNVYDDDAGATRPAAWSTSNGARWEREGDAGAIDNTLAGDQSFGRGTPYGPHVVAPLTYERLDGFHTMIRTSEGDWGQLVMTLKDDGEATPTYRIDLDVQMSAMPRRAEQTLVSGYGAARLYSTDQKPLGTLGDPTSWYSPTSSADDRPGTTLPLDRSTFESTKDGWRTDTESAHATLEGDDLRLDDPDVPSERAAVGAEHDGTEVFLADEWSKDGSSVQVRTWTRSDGGWSTGERLPSRGFSTPVGVTWAGDRWVVVGQRAKDAGDRHRRAAAWTSTDGRTWRAGGTLKDGRNGSGVSDVCALPGGEALAVGWIDQGDRSLPATWVSDGARWTRDVHEDVGAGWASQCVTTAGGVSVVMTADSRTRVLTTADGEAFEESFATDLGSSVDDLVPVGSGTVAAGWRDTPEYTGPVLWVSAGGAAWDWVPVPARSATAVSLHQVDGELVVTTDGLDGVQAWRLGDPQQMITASAATSRG